MPYLCEQKKYMYSILLNVVKAMILKAIVVNIMKDTVPNCWDAMCKEAQWSTSVEIKSCDILAYVMSTKFDDVKWRGMSREYIAHWCEQVWVYESLSTNGNHFSDVMKKQMLQNALDNVDDFRNICTVSQQTGEATTFEDYKVLVHSTADAYNKKSRAKKHATCSAYSHDIDVYNPVDYLYHRYDLNTDIDMIYANAANTCGGMISSDHFHQMTLEGHKIWISLPPKDHNLIHEQDLSSKSTLADSFCSTHGQGSGLEHGAFVQQRDKARSKLCVNFHDPRVLVYFHID